MPMPEAAMHENDLSPTRKYNVRCTRKVTVPQTKSKSGIMENSSNKNLGACVSLADRRHMATSFERCERVIHKLQLSWHRPRLVTRRAKAALTFAIADHGHLDWSAKAQLLDIANQSVMQPST